MGLLLSCSCWWSWSWTGGRTASEGTHPVVPCVVGDFGQAERLEEGREVHAEPPPVPLVEAVPATERVLRRASPRLARALGSRLLLVRRPERDPVALLRQPGVQVLDRPQVVGELGGADLADQHRRLRVLVLVHRVLRAPRWGLQHPRVLLAPRRHHPAPFVTAATKCGSSESQP